MNLPFHFHAVAHKYRVTLVTTVGDQMTYVTATSGEKAVKHAEAGFLYQHPGARVKKTNYTQLD